MNNRNFRFVWLIYAYFAFYAKLVLSLQVGTLAGDGTANFADGPSTVAQFNYPTGIQVDFGNKKVYVGDFYNNRIRTVQSSVAIVGTLAGDGSQDDIDGEGQSSSFYSPAGLYLLKTNNSLFVADSQNHLLRRVLLLTGYVSTLVGTGTAGTADGQRTSAQLNDPVSLTYYSGFLFIAECLGNRIRKVDYLGNMAVTSFAGSAVANAFADGQGAIARFSCPKSIDVDSNGNIYVADSGNHKIRKVTQSGLVSTVAGSGAQGSVDASALLSTFNQPSGLAVNYQSGDIVISDTFNHKIRLLNQSSNQVSTIAGSGVDSFRDGAALSAHFKYPHHLMMDNVTGTIIVADRDNERIRTIVSCKNGTYYEPSVNAWECISCPSNALSCNETGFTCDAGQEKTSNTCQSCTANSYKSTVGNQDCELCPVGTQASWNRTACQTCPSNFTRPFSLMTSCMQCPLNVVSCNSTHVDCGPKYYFDNSTLTCEKIYAPCDANKFRAFRQFDCYSCPQNANCTGTGEYFYCNRGYNLNGTENTCSLCPNGKYKPLTGNQDCTPCPTGFESAANETMCVPCPDGTFRSSITFNRCVDCPAGGQCTKSSMVCIPGWSLNTTRMNTCTQCPEGYFKSTYSTQACNLCAGGFYSNDDYTDCLECPAGEVRDTNDNSCILCGIGTETNYGRTACLPCNENYYRPNLSNRRCTACPNGASCTTTSFTCKTNWALTADNTGCTRIVTVTTTPASSALLSDEMTIAIICISAFLLVVGVYVWVFKPAPSEFTEPQRERKGYRPYQEPAANNNYPQPDPTKYP